jgi:hypothetical protein
MEIAPPPGIPTLVTSNLLILAAMNVLFPLCRNGVTSSTAAIRCPQPRTKPGGQRISFPPKLLAVMGLAL